MNPMIFRLRVGLHKQAGRLSCLGSGSMPVGKIAKGWQNLPMSKQRYKHDLPWLNWGDVEPEAEGEPSTAALALNCPIIHVMFEELQSLQVPTIKPVMKLAL